MALISAIRTIQGASPVTNQERSVDILKDAVSLTLAKVFWLLRQGKQSGQVLRHGIDGQCYRLPGRRLRVENSVDNLSYESQNR